MTANRNYSSTAGVMALQADISSSATTGIVDTVTGLPSQPFTIALDYGTSQEELVTVTSVSGFNLTFARGQDGTTAQAHTAGAVVRHVASARDFAEPAVHINQTSATHGVTGALLGTTDTQSVDNKTFVSGTGSTVPITVKAASSQSVDLMDWKNSSGTVIGSVDNAGRATLPGLLVTKPANSFATIIGRMGASQTLPLLDLQNVSSVSVFSVSITGAVAASGALTAPSVAAQSLTVTSGSTSAVTSTVKRIAGQTSDLSEWQTEGAAVLAKVDKDGNGSFTNLPGRFAYDSTVVVTDANGLADVPTGLDSGRLQFFIAWSGDSQGNANITIARFGTGAYPTNGVVTVRARQADTGASYGGHNVRVNWLAIGTL